MKIVPLLFAALLCSGCVYTHVETKDKARMTRISVLGDQRVGKVDLSLGKMEGYASEQSQTAAAVAEGVAAGLSKGRP